MENKELKVLEGALIDLYNIEIEINKTIKEIESEKNITTKVEAGELVQSRKDPSIFFVTKAYKARLFWERITKNLCSRYRDEIPTKEQELLFMQAIHNILEGAENGNNIY